MSCAIHVASLCCLLAQWSFGARVRVADRKGYQRERYDTSRTAIQSEGSENMTTKKETQGIHAEGSENITTKKEAQGCMYNQKDVVNASDRVTDLGVHDPRASGFGARLRQLGRALIEHRYIPLELTGEEARSLTLALYGIIISAVPWRCHKPLNDALAGMDKLIKEQQSKDKHWLWSNTQEINQAKKVLLNVLDGLPNACNLFCESAPQSCAKNWRSSSNAALGSRFSSEEENEQKRIGEEAADRLNYLRWGYWGPHVLAQSTAVLDANTSAPQIVVREYDEQRIKDGDLRLRQIWFHAKLHLGVRTEASLRQRMKKALENGRDRDVRAGIMKVVSSSRILQNARNARLEFIEYSGKRQCESAMEDEIDNLLRVFNTESGSFRAVLFFRERYWQSLKRGLGKFFKHPMLAFKKHHRRVKQEWNTNGYKLSMILGRVTRVASILGIAVGIATWGQSTLISVIVGTLFEDVSTSGFLSWIAKTDQMGGLLVLVKQWVQQIVGVQPIGDTLRELQVVAGGATLMYGLERVCADHRIRQQVTKMREQSQKIIESEDVAKIIESEDLQPVQNESDVTPEMVKDEVKRYIENMVEEGFVNEAVPVIIEKIRERQMELDPSFGWAPWRQWFIINNQRDSKALLNKTINYTDPEGKKSIQGFVEVVHNKGWNKRKSRLMEIRVPEKADLVPLRLTKEVKDSLLVRDVKVYKHLKAQWLDWCDWREYRGSTNSGPLLGKSIRLTFKGLNKNPRCNVEGVSHADATKPHLVVRTEKWHLKDISKEEATCLDLLAQAENGGFVNDVGWKILGLGTRKITVDIAKIVCTFSLIKEVKQCLQIQDPDAFARYQADTPRRSMVKKWMNGELDAAIEEVPKEDLSVEEAFKMEKQMRCNGNTARNATEQARIGNDLLRQNSKIGFKSEELLQQADDLDQDIASESSDGSTRESSDGSESDESDDEPSLKDVVEAAVECDDPQTCCLPQ